MSHTLQLISFKICPFVQRSVILLNEKKAKFDLQYVDLKNKPDWFLALSPLGKVPVLKVGDSTLFESAVISEYLDETIAPQLHPQDPLIKAQHRAWIEFSSSLIMSQYRMNTAGDAGNMEQHRQALQTSLQQLGEQCSDVGPFFTGETLSLIDTTIAPLFMRSDIIEQKTDLEIYPNQRLRDWAAALSARPSVKDSVVDDFEDLFIKYFENEGGYLFLALM